MVVQLLLSLQPNTSGKMVFHPESVRLSAFLLQKAMIILFGTKAGVDIGYRRVSHKLLQAKTRLNDLLNCDSSFTPKLPAFLINLTRYNHQMTTPRLVAYLVMIGFGCSMFSGRRS